MGLLVPLTANPPRLAFHRRCIRVLHLEPIGRAKRPERKGEPLRLDQVLESELAGIAGLSAGKCGTNRGQEASLDKMDQKVEAAHNVARHHLFCNGIAFCGARIGGLMPFFSRAALSTQLGRC